jgi:predicted RND superfamily exporter protein
MTRGQAQRHWPVLQLLVVGALVTALALVAISRLQVDANIYGLLGQDDPEVAKFAALASVTPGLEELLVICEPGYLLDRSTVEQISATPGIDASTRVFLRQGMSTVQGFSLTVDPADWYETGPLLATVRNLVAESPCGLTGTPAVVHEMQSRLNTDLLTALALATVLVGLMFSFIYRIGWLALLMLLPVGAGIAWGLAAFTMLRDELTLFAATVPTLLVGVGIDHCIHIIQSTRYSMRVDGLSRYDAVLLAWQRLLRPITLASLTTAVTFLALTLAGLKGLVDLGLAGTLVTLGVYAACIALLPAILLLIPERWLTRGAVLDSPMRTLGASLQARARPLLALFLLIGAVSGYGISQLELLSDNRLLESGDLPSLVLQDRIAEEHGLSASPMLLRFKVPRDAIELLAEADRPAAVANLIAVEAVGGLLQVHPVENPFVRHNYEETVAALDDWIDTLGLGDYEMSGAPAVNERINALIYSDLKLVLPFALAGILAVLAIGTRSLLRPCLVLLPLLLALIWLIGSMGLFGIPASVVTVAIMPLVLGIGVDGGVHLLAAWDRHRGDLQGTFAETGLAVVVTVMTSVAAFAAFMVSRSPSLVQFGSQAATTLTGCLVVTLVILPYLFRRLLQDNKASAP